MLEFAIAGTPSLSVNRLELQREGTTFTVDTLERLRAEDPSRELFFLIGGDSLNDLPGWRNPSRILELATIVAVNRGDRPFPDPQPLIDAVGTERASRVERITIPGIDLSSTDIRRRVREGRSIRFMVPRAVEEYIRQKRLYRPTAEGPAET
jgi:nicotinate-nucleotide adenylyltransferase